ncbi:hypothetical protein GDO78_012518 [Eleutherodactylus coqui]|uniref:Uncharacterized protein n=1 Tax=Eleutherodactylus coqui TaxID=57060 RepID=A0A8J6EZ98_ELECQ|nr:hypothetical protein GDO78_012518 [Eleutherodactylus coqui]
MGSNGGFSMAFLPQKCVRKLLVLPSIISSPVTYNYKSVVPNNFLVKIYYFCHYLALSSRRTFMSKSTSQVLLQSELQRTEYGDCVLKLIHMAILDMWLSERVPPPPPFFLDRRAGRLGRTTTNMVSNKIGESQRHLHISPTNDNQKRVVAT